MAVAVPLTAKGSVSTSAEEWIDLATNHEFLQDWTAMTESFTLARFLGGLTQEVVHPRYTAFVRSGRTSCNRPNIQQIPRKGGFREIFKASPGYLMLAVD
jgi:DNA polymerase I-like protein with 3'-5' exonuclease and polymerase domains